MAHSIEIAAFKDFVESFAKERSFKIVVLESEDGEGLIFRTREKKDIHVSLQTNVRNDTFLRDVAKFFEINHANKKSWPPSFVQWEETRRKIEAEPSRSVAKECAGPKSVSVLPAPILRAQPTQAIATPASKIGGEMKRAAEETVETKLPYLRRAAIEILAIYATLSSTEISAFLHHYVDVRCGQASPLSNLQAHEIAQTKLARAFTDKDDLTVREKEQLRNAVAVYLNASTLDRTRNREALVVRMATAMLGIERIEPDFEAIIERRKLTQSHHKKASSYLR